jgi:transposase
MERIEGAAGPIKYINLDRGQLRLEVLDVEQLIAADDAARLIWEVSGGMELSGFEQEQKSREGGAGRPCWPARLLVSVWVYSYTLGVASARAIERMMSHEPGLRWLAASETINHHTLADFRVGHREALEGLLAQFLALLDEAGVVDLRTLVHDGTKVKAVAGQEIVASRQDAGEAAAAGAPSDARVGPASDPRRSPG